MEQEGNNERWDRVETLFEALLELPMASRSAFLEENCGHDPLLREQVERLLLAYENNPDFLETPLVLEPEVDRYDPPYQRVGAYRLIRRLGSGGMGVVYLAERDDGSYRMRVAIKIVWPESSIPDLHERFTTERQILADLDHPNISRLYDGGVTSDGLPYLVMEYVDGERISHYCEQRNLGVLERLRLFRAVCEAVGYAHSQQVVHRDIKPGNILVTKEGIVKLLDFGIARVLEIDQAGAATRRLQTGTPILSFEYASPEQVRGDRVEAASDLYSLGVVLYELLTGRLPYDLPNRAPLQLAKAINEDRPLPLGKIASPVVTDQLQELLGRTLAKRPEARYPSVMSLVGEIDAILEGRPLTRTRFPIGRWPGKRVTVVFSLCLLLVASSFVGQRGRDRVSERWDLYQKQLRAAKQSIDEGRYSAAIDLLEGVDRSLAGFEWGYLYHHESQPDRLDLPDIEEVESAIMVDQSRSLLVVSQNYSHLRRWDLSTGTWVPGSSRHQEGIWGRTAVSLDGWVLLAQLDRENDQIKFEDYLSGETLTCPTSMRRLVDITIWKERWYTLDEDGTVYRWAQGRCHSEQMVKFEWTPGTQYSFKPNLPYVTALTGTTLEVWNFETARRVFRMADFDGREGEGELSRISFDPEGKLVAFLHPDGGVELHELQTGRRASRLLPVQVEVLTLLPDAAHRRLIVLYSSGRMGQLSLDGGEKREVLELETVIESGGQEWTDGRLLDEGRYLLVATGGGRLIIYDLLTRITVSSRKESEGGGKFLLRVAPATRRLITFGARPIIQFWRLDDLLRERSGLFKSEQRIDATAFAPSGRWFAAGGLDRQIYLWETAALDRPPRRIDSVDGILSLAFSPDGTQLVTAGLGPAVWLWDPETGKVVKKVLHGSSVHVATFSPDGRYVATGGFDGRVRITEVATGRLILDLPHPWEVTSLAFTAGGRRLLTGGFSPTIIEWDLSTSSETRRFEVSWRTVWSLAVSPDGRSLAIIGDGAGQTILQLDTGERVPISSKPLEGREIHFTPDGKRVILSTNDNALCIIEPETGRQMLQLDDLDGVVNSLAISPDGNLLVTGDITGRVQLLRAAR